MSLTCKPNLETVVTRLRSLYNRTAGDQIFATITVPTAALARFAQTHAPGECSYPDPAERAAFWNEKFRERRAIEDDSLPAAYLSEFDQGLYGGLLGGQVWFMADPATGWISSMVPPLLQDWSDFERLHFDPEHPWWRQYLRQMQVFVEAGRGQWGISHFILIDALNFVFELVGATRTYLSLNECPDMVRRAIDFAFDLNVRVQEAFFQTVPLTAGGTLSNFAQWLPGRVVSESLDPFHMTSVACFEQWGREPAERILKHFDGGVIHIHANGRHLLEAAVTLRGLQAVLLGDDRGFASAFDARAALKSRMGDMPASLFAPYQAFVEALQRHSLPGGVLYQVRDVPDVSAANRCMEMVRSYRV